MRSSAHLGKALAGVELATGSGAALGAALGGYAYQEGERLFGGLARPLGLSAGEVSFLTPLLVATAISLGLLPP
eukprot:4989357-Prymnesium_polylepis.1